jgi:hypothetical protein
MKWKRKRKAVQVAEATKNMSDERDLAIALASFRPNEDGLSNDPVLNLRIMDLQDKVRESNKAKEHAKDPKAFRLKQVAEELERDQQRQQDEADVCSLHGPRLRGFQGPSLF